MKKYKSARIDAANVGGEELELINAFTLEPVTAEDVFCFSVVLCDNEIDRDGERFDLETLGELAEMFIGKPGITDHIPSAGNQISRIYAASLETDESVKTAAGESYTALKARCYLPVTPGNSEFISAVRTGIIKEVSIGCSINERLCSVCGKSAGSCRHLKGREYGKKLCHTVLRGAKDAYEFSFVAVPAQRRAGVTKGFGEEVDKTENEEDIDALMEKLAALTDEVAALREAARYADHYKAAAAKRLGALALAAIPELEGTDFLKITNALSPEETEKMERAFARKAGLDAPLAPTLAPAPREKEDLKNYII